MESGRNAGSSRGLFQGLVHAFLGRIFHRHQRDQLQIGQPQAAFAERNLVQRTTHDDEQFQRADLHGVVDEPDPRRRAVERPAQGVTAEAEQPPTQGAE